MEITDEQMEKIIKSITSTLNNSKNIDKDLSFIVNKIYEGGFQDGYNAAVSFDEECK